jgi:hypothetical protein
VKNRMRTPFAALAGLAALCCGCAWPARAQDTQTETSHSGQLRQVTPDQYRAHLQELQGVVATCSAQRSATACNPGQVGPDDTIAGPAGSREVHYGWLRSTLKDATADIEARTDTAAAKNQVINENAARLQSAAQRLTEDAKSAPTPFRPNDQVRKNLDTVLSQREFTRVEQPSFVQRAEAAAWQWIFERLSGVAAYGGRNPWFSRLLIWAGITAPCALLLWWVLLRSRKQMGVVTSSEPVEATAPSAREWQRWMDEAEAFAGEHRWREAVHHVYWAAISRLEARGLWPADRARTPREYLALLHQNHVHQPDLRRLTQAFERIWYGHRPAEEQQYRQACALMERLKPR